jgi:hypothetical protein
LERDGLRAFLSSALSAFPSFSGLLATAATGDGFAFGTASMCARFDDTTRGRWASGSGGREAWAACDAWA